MENDNRCFEDYAEVDTTLFKVNRNTVSDIIYITDVFRNTIENVSEEFIANTIDKNWPEWVSFISYGCQYEEEGAEIKATDVFWYDVVENAKNQFGNVQKYIDLLKGDTKDKSIHELIMTSNYNTRKILYNIYPDLVEGFVMLVYKVDWDCYCKYQSIYDKCYDPEPVCDGIPMPAPTEEVLPNARQYK